MPVDVFIHVNTLGLLVICKQHSHQGCFNVGDYSEFV